MQNSVLSLSLTPEQSVKVNEFVAAMLSDNSEGRIKVAPKNIRLHVQREVVGPAAESVPHVFNYAAEVEIDLKSITLS